MPERIGRHLRDTFWRSDLRLVRIATATGSLIWGATLLFGGYQFNRPAFFWLAELASQQTWGAAFLFVGLLQWIRAFLGVPTTAGLYACLAAALTFFLWTYVAIGIAFALSPLHAMDCGNIVIAALSALVFARAVARQA
jgi:hypothetical protein